MQNSDRISKITFLLMDCDGVLTDGRLYFSKDGEQLKAFFVRDGQGLVMLQAAGLRSGIISGRTSPILEMRARQLGVIPPLPFHYRMLRLKH